MLPSDRPSADAPTVIRPEGIATHRVVAVAPGQIIGPFELKAPLGAGGMASVWKAVDRETGLDVALKILPAELARDPDHVLRFQREAKSAAALDHPCIAAAYRCGEWDGIHAIAFEYVPGETLQQRLERSGPLDASEAVSYLHDLAAALAHASNRNVVHRDVKPANIVVTPEGRAKLIDMGLARRQDGNTANGGVTTSGVTLGTFDYLSPEQALDPRQVDVRSDLYSLGCTFYHCLTGRSPVPEGTAARKLHFHQHEKPSDPRTLIPSIPDDLAFILSRLMMKRPDDRYQSAEELERDLLLLDQQLKASAGNPLSNRLGTTTPIPMSWLVATAALAIAILLALTQPSGINRDSKMAAANPKSGLPAAETSGQPSANVPNSGDVRTVTNPEELVSALKEGLARIRLEPGREFDLTTADAIVFTGKQLLLETESDRPPAVLIIPATIANPDFSTTLTFRSVDHVELRRLIVRTVPSIFDEGPIIKPSGLFFDRVAHIELVGCRFEMHENLRAGKAASVEVNADPGCEMLVRSSLFPVGSVAMRLNGEVKTNVIETAFGPHESVFDLAACRGSVTLRHDTFLFRPDGGSVFDLDPQLTYSLSAEACLFGAASPPAATGMMMGHRDSPTLFRTDGTKPVVKFTINSGETNVVYRMGVALLGESRVAFERRGDWGIEDPIVDLALPPWNESDPLAALSDTNDPWRAFRARLDIPSLRIPKDVIVGVRHRTPDGTQRIYPGDWPPPRPADLTAGTVKVWWPQAPANESLPRNAARQLDELLAVARSGDTIEIRHTGKLTVRPVRLDSPGIKLTFRAAEGSRPILVPDPTFPSNDSFLFDAMAADLTFENLDFLVAGRGEPTESRRLAVVRMNSQSASTFRRCVVTLNEADERAAVALVEGSEGETRRIGFGLGPGAGSGPRLKWEDCLIRGTGRGLWIAAARPFHFEANHCVVSLNGNFLSIDPPVRMLPFAARGHLQLNRSTIAVSGSFIAAKGGRVNKGRPLVLPLEVDASSCIFASIGSPRTFVQIEDGDSTEPSERFLNWQFELPNKYVNYDQSSTMFEVKPIDTSAGSMSHVLDADDWLRVMTKEPGRALSRIRFAHFPLSGRDAIDVVPADFVVQTRRNDMFTPSGPIGADTQLLPKPVE
ncbi:MAG: serine/threonine-protein kinase [Gemmataceae bacterium]